MRAGTCAFQSGMLVFGRDTAPGPLYIQCFFCFVRSSMARYALPCEELPNNASLIGVKAHVDTHQCLVYMASFITLCDGSSTATPLGQCTGFTIRPQHTCYLKSDQMKAHPFELPVTHVLPATDAPYLGDILGESEEWVHVHYHSVIHCSV